MLRVSTKEKLSKMSVDELLDSYYYAREEWESINRPDDYADISVENHERVWHEMDNILEEIRRRCGEENTEGE